MDTVRKGSLYAASFGKVVIIGISIAGNDWSDNELNGRTECDRCRMYLTECICECHRCGRYTRFCICVTEEQKIAQLQKQREEQSAYVLKNYRVDTIIYKKYDGTGRVVSVDLDRKLVEVSWTTHSLSTNRNSWFNFQSCMEDLVILIRDNETSFSSEFQKGAIVEYIDAQKNMDKTKYNCLTGKFVGEVIQITDSRNSLTVLWESGELEDVNFKQTPFIKIVCRMENAVFDIDLVSERVIDFTGDGPYAYIIDIAEDRRTMRVQWESYDGYPDDTPVEVFSYLQYFAQYGGEYHSLTTTEDRIDQLIYEDQSLEASLMMEDEDYDDYDGDY